jgi:hypothetical protein
MKEEEKEQQQGIGGGGIQEFRLWEKHDYSTHTHSNGAERIDGKKKTFFGERIISTRRVSIQQKSGRTREREREREFKKIK